MSQPIPTVVPFPGRDRLLAALSLDRSLLPIELYDNGVRHVYVALTDEDALARLAPDFAALAPLASDPTPSLVGANCFACASRR